MYQDIVTPIDAAKSPRRKVVEETFWFTLKFSIGIVFLFFFTTEPSILLWLETPVRWPDANAVYHPVWEPFKKWMVLLGVYLFFVGMRLGAFVFSRK